eukprot:scaffold7066_cov253-Pinguiococcus_pyrenoidosus.AAC.24
MARGSKTPYQGAMRLLAASKVEALASSSTCSFRKAVASFCRTAGNTSCSFDFRIFTHGRIHA